MPSRIPTMPRKEPRKETTSSTSAPLKPMSKSRPTSLSLKTTTRLPVPSQPSPTTSSGAPVKKHLHSRSNGTIKSKLPQSPQPHSLPTTSKSKSISVPSKAYKKESHGLLTPTSSGPKSPRQFSTPGISSSPKAPRKVDHTPSRIVTTLQSPISPAKSPYMHAHFGDACVAGALVHQLSCNHKVMTRVPEQCKSNCQRPLPEQIEKYANSKDESRAFVCAACVEELVQGNRDTKRAMLLQNFTTLKSRMGKISEDWMASQMSYWEKVWENDIQKERAEFAKLGETCAWIPKEPLSATPALGKIVEESTSVPWPPRSKPQKARAPSNMPKLRIDSVIQSD